MSNEESTTKEYKTIAELAKIIGKSKNVLYEIIAKEPFKSYVIVQDGIKKVSVDFIEAWKKYQAQEPIEEKAVDSTDTSTDNETDLEQLQKEVERLNSIIAEKDRQLVEWGNKFAELASQAQILASQAQVLHAKELPAATEGPQEAKEGFFRRLFRKRT